MARLARWASSPSAIDDVIANSSPKVSPAQRSTASACSTGSAMPSNQASSASAASSGVGRTAIVTPCTPVAIRRTVKARRQAPQRQPSADSP